MTFQSIHKITFFALCFLLLVSCGKETIADEIKDKNPTIVDFENLLESEMTNQHLPAIATLIFEGDEVLYESYLGKSHIANGVDLAKKHPFLLASISKVVTATALLQLQEAGNFQLDDPINDYLNFEVNHPDYNTNITFRMLLTHTSGIADGNAGADENYYYGQDSPVALNDFLENFLVPGGNLYDDYENFYGFEPGTDHEYTNMGNALIGVLVEQISGMDFSEYCQQHIFTPLNMNDTHWRLEDITGTIVQPYDYVNGQFEAIQHYTFTDYPNGGLRSTVRDMFTFLSAFAQNGVANNFQLLSMETVVAMITPQIPTISNDVGLHLFQMNTTHNLWGHDGGEAGVATIMGFNPSTKVGALIFTNQGEADLEAILEESYELGLVLK